MSNPKRYSEKVNRKDEQKTSGLQIPAGSYNMMSGLSIIKPHFQPHFKSIHSTGSEVRAKLEISQPEDPSEVQAEEIAESVMTGDVENSQEIVSQSVPEVSRESEGSAIQTSHEFDVQLQNTKGQGQKLDEGTKEEVEAHTNSDLSDVNVHTDPKANEMSKSINAKAFTHGRDIYFGAGKFNPGSEEGKRLLAHEIAHTQQQRHEINRKIYRQPDDPSKKVGFVKKDPAEFGSILSVNAYLKEKPDEELYDSDIELTQYEGLSVRWESEDWYYVYLMSEHLDTNVREGYVFKEDVILGTFYLPEFSVQDTFHLDTVRQYVKDNDDALGGGIFYDFENDKTVHLMRLFNSREQYLFRQDHHLYKRVQRLLSEWDFSFATALWPEIGLLDEAGQPYINDTNKDKKSVDTYRYTEPKVDFEKEFPTLSSYQTNQFKLLIEYEKAYTAYEAYKDDSDKKQEFLGEIAKLGFTGDKAEWLFRNEIDNLKETLYNYVVDAAVAFARKGMDASEKVIDVELIEFSRGKMQPIVDALAATSSDYEGLQDIKRLPGGDVLFRYNKELQYNTAIRDWRLKLAQKYPIFLDENLNIEKLYEDYVVDKKDQKQLQITLLNTCHDRLENIRKTKEEIRLHPNAVWKLNQLLGKTTSELNLDDGIFKTLIDEKIKDENSSVSDFVLGTIAFALSILALFSGPFAPLLLGISAIIGLHLTNKQYEDYQLKHNAHNISHNQAEALTSEDPSLFWVAFGLIAVGLDMGGVIGALGLFKPLMTNVRFYSQLRQPMKEAATLYDTFSDEIKLLISKSEFMRIMRSAARKQFMRVNLLTEEIAAMTREETLLGKYFWEYEDLLVRSSNGKMTNPKMQEIANRIDALDNLRLTDPGKVANEIPGIIEKLEGMNVVSEIRSLPGINTIGKDKNVAFTEHFLTVRDAKGIPIGQINGRSIGVSGKSPGWDNVQSGTWDFAPVPSSNRAFTAIDGAELDSEVKIFEKFASQIGTIMNKTVKEGQVYDEVTGEIFLFTEKTPCESCSNILLRFRTAFPNVKVHVTWGYEKTIK